MSNVLIIDGDFIPYRVGYSTDNIGGGFEMARYNVNKLIDEFCAVANTAEIIGFLGGPKNYRNDIVKNMSVVVPDYKGNRVGRDKPKYFKQIKAYLQDKFKFTLVNGMEADDACSIALTRLDNGICLSTDKDLLQVPGKHIQVKHSGLEKYLVSLEGTLELSEDRKKVLGTGNKLLWAQMLTGDGVDNFKGIPGCGPVKAVNLLKNVADKDLAKVVFHEYKKAFGASATEMFKLTWNLAYLLRFHKDFSTPDSFNICN